MRELDNFDLRLLACLEEDARQTLSHIAKKLRSSQQDNALTCSSAKEILTSLAN